MGMGLMRFNLVLKRLSLILGLFLVVDATSALASNSASGTYLLSTLVDRSGNGYLNKFQSARWTVRNCSGVIQAMVAEGGCEGVNVYRYKGKNYNVGSCKPDTQRYTVSYTVYYGNDRLGRITTKGYDGNSYNDCHYGSGVDLASRLGINTSEYRKDMSKFQIGAIEIRGVLRNYSVETELQSRLNREESQARAALQAQQRAKAEQERVRAQQQAQAKQRQAEAERRRQQSSGSASSGSSSGQVTREQMTPQRRAEADRIMEQERQRLERERQREELERRRRERRAEEKRQRDQLMNQTAASLAQVAASSDVGQYVVFGGFAAAVLGLSIAAAVSHDPRDRAFGTTMLVVPPYAGAAIASLLAPFSQMSTPRDHSTWGRSIVELSFVDTLFGMSTGSIYLEPVGVRVTIPMGYSRPVLNLRTRLSPTIGFVDERTFYGFTTGFSLFLNLDKKRKRDFSFQGLEIGIASKMMLTPKVVMPLAFTAAYEWGLFRLSVEYTHNELVELGDQGTDPDVIIDGEEPTDRSHLYDRFLMGLALRLPTKF